MNFRVRVLILCRENIRQFTIKSVGDRAKLGGGEEEYDMVNDYFGVGKASGENEGSNVRYGPPVVPM